MYSYELKIRIPYLIDNVYRHNMLWIFEVPKMIFATFATAVILVAKQHIFHTHWGRDRIRPSFCIWYFEIHLREWTRILIQFPLHFVSNCTINIDPSLVQIRAMRRTGDKPLSEPMMFYFNDAYMRLSTFMNWTWQCPLLSQISGALAVTSIFHMALGFTGLVGCLTRIIGPLTISPAVALISVMMYEAITHGAKHNWGITILWVNYQFSFDIHDHIPGNPTGVWIGQTIGNVTLATITETTTCGLFY